MLIDLYKRSQVAKRYYAKLNRQYKPAQAGRQLKQDANIDFKLLNEVIDEGYAIQKSILKEAKKRAKLKPLK